MTKFIAVCKSVLIDWFIQINYITIRPVALLFKVYLHFGKILPNAVHNHIDGLV